jgi:hypothetical protein
MENRERPLEERPPAGEVAVWREEASEVDEAHRGVRMLRAERLLADRQRPLAER